MGWFLQFMKHEEFPLLSIRCRCLKFRGKRCINSHESHLKTPPFPCTRQSLFMKEKQEQGISLPEWACLFAGVIFVPQWSTSDPFFFLGGEVGSIVGRINITILYYVFASCCSAYFQFRVWPYLHVMDMILIFMIVCSCEVSKTSKTVTEKKCHLYTHTHAKQLPASQRHASDTFRSRELPTGSPLQMSWW